MCVAQIAVRTFSPIFFPADSFFRLQTLIHSQQVEVSTSSLGTCQGASPLADDINDTEHGPPAAAAGAGGQSQRRALPRRSFIRHAGARVFEFYTFVNLSLKSQFLSFQSIIFSGCRLL